MPPYNQCIKGERCILKERASSIKEPSRRSAQPVFIVSNLFFFFFIAIWPIVLKTEQQNLSGFKEVNLDHVCFSDRALKISIQTGLIIVIFLGCYKGLKILGWSTYGEKNSVYLILESKTFGTCASIGQLRYTFWNQHSFLLNLDVFTV